MAHRMEADPVLRQMLSYNAASVMIGELWRGLTVRLGT